MDIEQDAGIYDNKNKPKSNNRSHYRKSDNVPKDTPDKMNMRHSDKWQNNGQTELNSFQMKTYGKSKKMGEVKPKKECVKPRLSQSNKITNTNLTHHSILSSASSSEDDVFQTRYSIQNKYDNGENNDTNECTPNSKEKISDVSNMKTYPEIIEDEEYRVIAKQMSISKEQRETRRLKETKSNTELRDFFGEENNSDADIKSNSVQISDDDNIYADFNFSDTISAEKSNKCIKEMMVDVTVTPKQFVVSKNSENHSIAEADNIIEDFLNGTLDTTIYQPVSCENTKLSEQYENDKLKSVMQINEGKRNNKRKVNELVTENKRVKQETILDSKNGKNNRERAKEHNKKPKELNEAKNLNRNQILNTFSNRIEPQQKKTKKKFDGFNININFLGLTDSSHENRQMKSKNCQMNHEDKNTYNTEEDSIRNKYSRRKVRSSSRIASKKIKEIEKIENLLDLDEEIIDVEDTNIYDIFNTRNEHNNMETLHSLRGNSNTFKPKTDSTYRKKEKYVNKNSEMSMQHDKIFTALKERENLKEHSQINKNNAAHTDERQISRPIIHLLKSPGSSKIPTKQNTCKDGKNIQSTSLNSFYRYMANANNSLSTDNQTVKKKSKKDIDSKKLDLARKSNRFFAGENSQTEDADMFTVSKASTKESKPRTWKMLENELLEDLDNEQKSDHVCETVILKKQETVMKKEVAKDRNLFTVSNTSMLHTISKSKTGNNYNLKYEIKNTKSKFEGPKSDPKYNFKNTTIGKQMTGGDLNFKSNAIVNKSIAAMEKCAAKFIRPEAKLFNAEHTVSNWQHENLFDNQNKETQFHSHLTFEAHDDEKCYSSRVTGYMKRGNKVKKSCDLSERGNMSEEKSNSMRTQRNKRSSQKALSTEYSFKSTKNNLPIEYPQSHTNNDKTLALVQNGEERNNPWENLMNELHLSEEYPVLNEENNVYNCEMKDHNSEKLIITKTFTQNSNDLKRNETLLIQTDYEVNKAELNKETLTALQIPADMESDTKQSEIYKSETLKISHVESLTSRNIRDQSDTEINFEENKICKKFELQKVNNQKPKIPLLNTASEKNKVKSPSFKFQLNKYGALKLKKHSSTSSSSEKSGDSPKLKRTKLHEEKDRKCSSSATNKARDKYKIYLKKLLDKRNSAIDDKIKSIEDTNVSNKNVLKETLDESPKSLKTKDSLIAMQEDDIFSLSSSDESSDTSEKNYGTGAMCELFDK